MHGLDAILQLEEALTFSWRRQRTAAGRREGPLPHPSADPFGAVAFARALSDAPEATLFSLDRLNPPALHSNGVRPPVARCSALISRQARALAPSLQVCCCSAGSSAADASPLFSVSSPFEVADYYFVTLAVAMNDLELDVEWFLLQARCLS